MQSKMTPKDLINIGVFLVLYFITMAVNALAVAGPIWIYLALVISAPLGGIVFQLFLTRVKRPGMIMLFGLIFGAFMTLAHGWQTLILVIIFSALAEVIMWLGRYRSKLANFWTYPVFQLWSFGPIVPIIMNADAYHAMLIESRDKSVAYADEVISLSTNPVFIGAIVAGVFILSIVGSWVGQRMLSKHFVKAGIA